MAEINFQFGNGNPESKSGLWVGRVFLFLFAIPFAVFGLSAAWSGAKKIAQGDSRQGIALVLFGLLFSAVGLGLMYAAVTAARRMKAAAARWKAQTEDGQKAWLARSDWAAGKIKSSAGNQWKILLFMGAIFSAIGGGATFLIARRELSRGNYAAGFILLFPLVGVLLVAAAIRGLQARRRFGDCFFELAQVPAPLGGTLDGLIQIEKPLRIDHGLHLKLSCIRRTVSGSGDNRNVQEDILWQNEKVFRPDASLPTTNSGGTGIPVHFSLPADQPEASARGTAGIVWRLEARAKMAGPDFSAAFEVPVFRMAGAPIAAAAADADPTAPLQMSAEEIRRDEHSKIQVAYGPNGREFYFPAARNPGVAIVLTVILAVWSGFLWLIIVKHAPFLFPLVLGLAEIILLWGCVNLWFKSSRVTANSSEVVWQTRWLIFNRTRRADAAEILRFDLKPGMTSGQTVFYDIKLVTRTPQTVAETQAGSPPTSRTPLRFRVDDPGGFTVAGGISSRPEADWLVREMTAALGRRA